MPRSASMRGGCPRTSSGNGCCRPSTSASRTGRGEFLAELRPAYPLFVRFGGIDYDDDDDAIAKLDDFVRRAQRILADLRRQPPPADARRQGRVPVRRCSVRRSRTRTTPRARLRRRARAARARVGDGRHRHPDRDHVRPAAQRHVRPPRAAGRSPASATRSISSARLMAKAPPGQIYVAEPVRHAAGDAFDWEQLPPLTVKGKAEPVSAYSR